MKRHLKITTPIKYTELHLILNTMGFSQSLYIPGSGLCIAEYINHDLYNKDIHCTVTLHLSSLGYVFEIFSDSLFEIRPK